MKKNPVKTIDVSLLRRYLEARKIITKRADSIVSVSHLLGLLRHCGDDTLPVSPHALATCAEQINSDLCAIIECLDDFIFPTDAESALER